MASEIRVNKIINRSGLSTVTFSDTGAIVSGIVTANSFSGAVTGSGANLTSIPAGQLTGTVADARLSTVSSSKLSGALPALDGSALTGVGLGTDGSANTSGIITATAFVPTTQGSLSHRNIVINGAMTVAQRGTSSTSNLYATVDRFRFAYSGVDENPTNAQVDVASGTTPYTLGFRKALKVTNGNQTSGAGSADRIAFEYRIEAQDIAGSGWNYTSASSNITLSFWIKSSVAQNFHFYFETVDGTAQIYPMSTGTLSADTWTKITKTIPGNSNIQIDNNNEMGLKLYFSYFTGTDYTNNSQSLNAWGAYSSASRFPDDTSTWYTTNDSTLEMTGLQLEVGPVATPFEHRSLQEELIRCQRYFNMIGDGTNFGTNKALSDAFMWSANEIDFMYTFPVEMRTTPSLYQVTGSDYFQVQGGGHNTHIDGNFTQQYGCKRSTSQYAGSDSSRTSGASCHIFVKNSAARYGYNAEI